ncbi:MAG: peptidylprolyl isomerase [Burkholderiales bacterium]|nr:peptidylprolyl isomerase [Burkholderiales bacterium]
MLKSRSLLMALALAVALPAGAQGNVVLLSNSLASVTRGEYEAELLKLPPEMREGFANNPRRVNELLVRMLVQKSLAAQARAAKLDVKPENATRLALEVERFLAALEVESVEKAAAAEFDANIQKQETRARELYLVDKASFTQPAQVSATHILFSTKKRSSEEARKLAVEARAKIVAGADMATLAREQSDDPSAAANGGALGFFAEKEMDPAFGAAAFALAKPGDVSQPVQSSFGWHVIRLDDRKAATVQPYEQAREVIMAQLRKRYVDEKREAAIAAVRRDPKTQVNVEAVTALTPKVDTETIRRAIEAANAAGGPAK